MVCGNCKSEIPPASRFCLSCGSALSASSEIVTQAVSAVADGAPSMLTTSAEDEGRFVAGSILGDRYRVIALLGRGGMGEVYRATDLKLNQPVALKFLPEALSKDQKSLNRFYNEVKIARQISHPNVCRVYDIGEVNGVTYISMEFISGEDLNSLLRRIGRIPANKATEMASQLCSGLLAAHEKGVLHRDLKPANVMLDERGSLRVMDFGLAGVIDQIADVRSGTPAYMSPEQLAGKEVTVKSDIYSLGLVLYEVFTGKRPFEAASLEELKKKQTESSPISMTSQVSDLDPAVENIILKCLAADPKDRPASVRVVLSALPGGGDMLSAVLAAGDTPSPELVAAAGDASGLLPVSWIVAMLALTMVSLGTLAWFGPQVTFLGMSKPELSPEVLEERASRVIRRAGYPKPLDSVHGLQLDMDYVAHRREIAPEKRWSETDKQHPGPIVFWYRESPRYLVSRSVISQGVIGLNDPPMTASGMVTVQMDLKGRLTSFEATPPQVEEKPSDPAAPPVDWQPWFRFAGLDGAKFQPVEPKWVPLAGFDARSAWEGPNPGDTSVKLRIEAASWRGRAVYFDVVGPWTIAHRAQRPPEPPGMLYLQIIGGTMFVLVLASVIFFARFHLRQGRGDRKGAFRLAMFVVFAYLTLQVIGAHHVPSFDEFLLFQIAGQTAVYLSGVVWLFYLALEPPVRKRWPQTLVSWSRVLAGRIWDPLVGSHVLVGMAAGSILAVISYLVTAYTLRVGDLPIDTELQTVLGLRFAASGLIANLINAAAFSLVNFFLLFLFKILFRKNWLAAAVFLVLFTVSRFLTPGFTVPGLLAEALGLVMIVYVLMRYGLLAQATMAVMGEFARRFYLTFDFGEWYGSASLFVLVILSAAALISFRLALGGRKLISDRILDVS
jgi:serine/threonine protein kinase